MLLAWSGGDRAALDRLIPLVSAELHRLAHHYMRGERVGHTLQTTALVNEAYVRLVDANRVEWRDRAHFFAVSANLMRRILVDFARRRRYQKRGGGAVTIASMRTTFPARNPGRTSSRSTPRSMHSRPSTPARPASSSCGSSAD